MTCWDNEKNTDIVEQDQVRKHGTKWLPVGYLMEGPVPLNPSMDLSTGCKKATSGDIRLIAAQEFYRSAVVWPRRNAGLHLILGGRSPVPQDGMAVRAAIWGKRYVSWGLNVGETVWSSLYVPWAGGGILERRRLLTEHDEGTEGTYRLGGSRRCHGQSRK